MKKLLTLSALILIGLAAFTGCKKSSSSTPTTTPTSPTSSYYMTGTSGGTAFSLNNSVTMIGTAHARLLEGFNGDYSIIGLTIATSTFPSYSFTFWNADTVGNYIIDNDNIQVIVARSMFDIHSVVHGTMTITTSDSFTIAGTYNFTLDDSTTVTGGTFKSKRYN